MSVSTSAKLSNLRELLAAKPDQEVLRMYLTKADTTLLKHAVLVTMQRKWSANPPYRLTEIGMAIYDRLKVNDGQPTTTGPHAENILNQVWSLHLVIREHAHLDSTLTGLAPFDFGTTVYTSKEEAMSMLQDIWNQRMDETKEVAGLRPVIYMTFDNNDSVSKTRRVDFDFDAAAMDTTVAILDAQIIPQQSKITRHTNATFEYLLSQFKISGIQPDNAGNAAMYAAVIAILSALRLEIYSSVLNKVAKPGRTGQSSSKSAQSVIKSLVERPTPAPPYGVTVYCWRCGSGMHAFVECPNTDISCNRCEQAMHQWRRENAGTHIGAMCAFR